MHADPCNCFVVVVVVVVEKFEYVAQCNCIFVFVQLGCYSAGSRGQQTKFTKDIPQDRELERLSL